LNKTLIECTIIAVKLFIELYNNEAISLETFKSHTQLKIKLLKDYVNQTDPEKSQLAQHIIMKHESILHSHHVSCNTPL
jgi:hypothetical protein